MPLTLNALLADSAHDVAQGRTAWRQMSEFARFHWLATAENVSPELVGEFYFLRAGAADVMGMTDEAIAALGELNVWADSRGDNALTLVGKAHLAFHALNQDEPSVYPLGEPEDRLRALLEDFHAWRPTPDSPTVGEEPTIRGESIDRPDAVKLATAATTAYSVAVNVSEQLAEVFAGLVRRFGTAYPTEADRLLWYAQRHWFSGRKQQAYALASEVLSSPDTTSVSRFDAHDMLGHFALLEGDEAGVAEHWARCVELARIMDAPVIAMRHAELTARVYFSQDRAGEAWQLSHDMVTWVDGVPVGPILLDLQEVIAQSAFENNLFEEAWDTARSVIHWSEMTPNDQRTASCYAIATFAGLRLGLAEEVFDLQHRRAELLKASGRLLDAAEVFQTLAYLDEDAATAYLRRSWELIEASQEEGKEWHVAEWLLTMAQFAEGEAAVDFARRATSAFEQLGHPVKEAFALLAEARAQLAMGETDLARQAYAQANVAMPAEFARPAELDAVFAQVKEELGG